MRVLSLTRYTSSAASSRLRFAQYFPALRKGGLDITFRPLLTDEYLKHLYEKKGTPFGDILKAYWARLQLHQELSEYDVLWIEKELFPFLPIFFEETFFTSGIPIVIDIDDAIFHNYDIHRNLLVRALLGKKFKNIFRRAHLVIAGNSYLANTAAQYGARNVVILPTVVDLARYNAQVSAPTVFTVGWIGTPQTAKYLQMLREPLTNLQSEFKNKIALRWIGLHENPLPDLPASVVPWQEATEAEELAKLSVGLMPLQDSPWERGKCGYKLIQYMATGLPVIASPIGINCEIVKRGENGFLAQDNTAWLQNLKALLESSELRQRLGTNGRKMVEEKFSLQKTASYLTELLIATGASDHHRLEDAIKKENEIWPILKLD